MLRPTGSPDSTLRLVLLARAADGGRSPHARRDRPRRVGPAWVRRVRRYLPLQGLQRHQGADGRQEGVLLSRADHRRCRTREQQGAVQLRAHRGLVSIDMSSSMNKPFYLLYIFMDIGE